MILVVGRGPGKATSTRFVHGACPQERCENVPLVVPSVIVEPLLRGAGKSRPRLSLFHHSFVGTSLGEGGGASGGEGCDSGVSHPTDS